METCDDNPNAIFIYRNDDENMYMSAHENKKHIYWTQNKGEWETFLIDTTNENKIRTCHNTYMSDYLGNGRLWQIDNTCENDSDEYFPVRVEIVSPFCE